MRTPHLTQLRVLESVLRRGSFAAAAEELGVTVAAVGQQVRHLEEVLGQALFERHPRGVRPTRTASAVTAELAAGFDRLDEAMRRLRRAHPPGRVALSTTQGIGEYWLPHRFTRLYEAVPGIELSVDTTPAIADLHGGEVDFAVRFSLPPGPEYAAIDMIAAWMVPMCAPDFAARYGLAPGRRDLTGVPLWTVEDPTSDPDWVDWARWSRETGVTLGPEETMPRFTGYGSGRRLVRSGLGMMIGVVSDAWAAIEEGRLILPLGPEVALSTSHRYRLVWLKERRLGPVQRRFTEWFAAAAEAHRREVGELLGRAPGTL